MPRMWHIIMPRIYHVLGASAGAGAERGGREAGVAGERAAVKEGGFFWIKLAFFEAKSGF